MSGPVGASPWMYGIEVPFYEYEIEKSLRINKPDNATLSWTPSSTQDSDKIFTVSFWWKRGAERSTIQHVFNSVNAGSGTGQGYTGIGFANSNELMYFTQNGGDNGETTGQYFIDSSAWYHFCWQYDTSQATDSNRIKFYVNGVHIPTTSSNWTNTGNSLYPAQDSVMSSVNASGRLQRWGYDTAGNGQPADGYLAEVYMLDGVTTDCNSFGEFKDGIWVPKEYTGSYGTNGYRLEFKQTGTNQDANGIGADTSGNNNHWAVTNIVASDVVPDTPTANWATMNPLMINTDQVTSGVVMTEGNLKVATGGFSATHIGGGFSTIAIPKDKKIYMEVCETATTGDNWSAGILIKNHVQNSTSISGNGSVSVYNRSVYVNGTETDYGSSAGLGGLGVAKMTAGNVLGIAVDGATGKVWFSRNGVWFKSPSTNNSGTTGNPSAGTHEIGTITNTTAINPSGEIFLFLSGNTSTDNLFVNFGQESTFAGNKSAGTQSDANGKGLFQYAVPTDHVCLDTSSMVDITIGPNQDTQADDHFNTVLYTGNATARSITGVGFNPDWVWIKPRSDTDNHVAFDSVRGVQKRLYVNSATAEATRSGDGLSSFNADGFSIGDWNNINENSQTYVAWNWKGGGSSNTFNIDGTGYASASDAGLSGGDITPTGASVNTTAGFSMIAYTGNGSASQTIKHGLSSTPEFIIIKDRDANSNNDQWQIIHTGAGNTYGYFTTDAFAGTGQMSASATTVTIGLDATALTNESGDDFIMYCFHSVEGYSNFGFYMGNGANQFVYTGFKPAFILEKRSSNVSAWNLYDNKRGPYPTPSTQSQNNRNTKALQPHVTDAEATYSGVNFVSNGYQPTGTLNDSGQKIIYIAFAEDPFKYSNAH